MRSPVWLLPLVLSACGPDLDAGIDAYRAGRYQQARDEFARIEAEAADGGPVEASYGRALAALQMGELRDAEAAVEAMASRGEGEILDLTEFLRGNLQFARCELAEQQAGAAEAEPFAYDLAILHAEKAQRAWQTAAVTRPDWPEARRNVDRALRKLIELRRQKADKADQNRKQRTPRVRPQPAPTAEPPPQPDPDKPPDPTAAIGELTADQVLGLLERLAEKEREKLGDRGTRRASRQTGVEKDW